jgi:putative DNA-invertase from lambdoid prophage Rac
VKQDQKDRGRYLRGKVPFGFRNGEDGSFVPDPTEDALIADARALREDGAVPRTIQQRWRHSMGGSCR